MKAPAGDWSQSPLLTDLYQLVMLQAYFDSGMNEVQVVTVHATDGSYRLQVEIPEFEKTVLTEEIRFDASADKVRQTLQHAFARALNSLPETAKIDRVFEAAELDDVTLAREVGQKWATRQGDAVLSALVAPARTPEREKARRRLHGYLSRRGFRGPALSEGISAAEAVARESV